MLLAGGEIDPVTRGQTEAFLLALDEELDPEGQLAVPLMEPPEGREPGDNLALVVRRAPPEELAAPLGERERFALPKLQRVGGLHVVVIVKKQRGRTWHEPD